MAWVIPKSLSSIDSFNTLKSKIYTFLLKADKSDHQCSVEDLSDSFL